MIQKYKHIIWDWNGTLLDDIELCIDIMNGLLMKYNLDVISTDRYKEIFTIPVSGYYKILDFDLSNGGFEITGKEFIDIYELRKHECNLFPEVKFVLNKIKTMGIKQSVLSAYKHNTLIEILQRYEISEYFQFIIGASDIYGKGKIEQGKELIKLIDYDRSKILLIGDCVHDYEVAETLGINCILIAKGHQSKRVLQECGASVFNSLKDLMLLQALE